VAVPVVGAAAAATIASCAGVFAAPASSRAASVIPAATVDEAAAPPGRQETAVFAGGCFWGVQGVFEHVNGVDRAEAGYAGGSAGAAHYDDVSTGTTGHAESVRITYDPSEITYGRLLQIFFSVAHDPTELDRQGPDTGPQYRSAVFPQDATQQRIAAAYISQLNAADVFDAPIVTRVESADGFYPAERHHQDYLNSHPHDLYIATNDAPKLDDLKHFYPAYYRQQPALVFPTGN
jgi:peptide-methionine (S)-S-oxide reductase